MPRPGQGSGPSRPGSSHSFGSRPTSGHRISTPRPGSGRPGSSSNRNSYSQPGFGGGFMGPPPGGPIPPHYHRRRGPSFFPMIFPIFTGSRRRRRYDSGYAGSVGSPPPRRSSGAGIAGIVVVVIFCLLLFGAIPACFSSGGSTNVSDTGVPASTYNREKIDNPNPYDANDIIDHAGFFDNPSWTQSQLRAFYDQTGIQPMIVINSYDPSLKTDADKDAYAQEYYQEHIPNEDTFLYMYFPDADPDEVGYMTTVAGLNAASVMDSQAQDIFWNILDSQWVSDQSTDQVFANTFNQTAKRIMTRTATSKDIWSKVLIIGIIAAVVIGIIAVLVVRRRNEKQRAEETERILSTPLRPDSETSESSSGSSDDDLLNKYGG